MLDFRVYTFLEVCKYMNYTKAAETLCITQPAVSQHIKHLEKTYDTKFFTYKGKVLALTDSGERFYRIACAFANDEALFRRRLAIYQEEKDAKQYYNFGVTYTVAEYVVKTMLPGFLKANPDIKLNMKVANTEILTKDMNEGKIDFAIIEGQFSKSAFSSRVFSREDFVPVAAKNHKFIKKPETVQDLTEEELILREKGSGTREIFENALSLINFSVDDFENRMLMSNMTAIVELVRRDCGISFLYKKAVAEYLASGEIEIIPIRNFDISHDFSFVYSRDSVYDEVFLEIYKKMKAEACRENPEQKYN